MSDLPSKTFGSRAEVFAGAAQKTRGGLTADDLILNARGVIVSRRRSEAARANVSERFSNKKRTVAERVTEDGGTDSNSAA